MSVLITTEVQGQTQQGYDGLLGVLGPQIRRSPGFVLHTSFAVEGGWRVLEVWDTKAQANHFFARNVVPHLPPGIHPKRSVQDLHVLLAP